MHMHRHRVTRARGHSASSHLLAAAMLMALAVPAFAADPACLDTSGNPLVPVPGTDQGNEDGFENATCDTTASAYGGGNNASGILSSAFGHSNLARGIRSNAFGFQNSAYGDFSSAYGYQNNASGNYGSAFGLGNSAIGYWSMAFGNLNWANGDDSSAFGNYNRADGKESSAFGRMNEAWSLNGSAFGYRNIASGDYGGAFGRENTASGKESSAFGSQNEAVGSGSNAFGAGNETRGFESSAFGADNFASGDGSSAFGHGNSAHGQYSSAFGYGSQATGMGSTAIGYMAVADRSFTVSVGSAGSERQIIHLADGTQDFDAVNLRQLNAAIGGVAGFDPTGIAVAFGGGASWNGAFFKPPGYTIQGVDHGSVGDAFAAIDTWMTRNSRGVHYDDASHATVTLDGASGTQLRNVADGMDAMDSVNRGQMDASDAAVLASANAHADTGDTATLTASKSYTDTRVTQTVQSANAYTDSKFAAWNDSFGQFRGEMNARFRQADTRIDRMGAMNSAMIGMAASAAAVRGNHDTRIGAGVGTSNGRAALSVGVQHQLGSRTALTLGGAFSGNERSAMVGIGIGL